jgi:hypothetical protein
MSIFGTKFATALNFPHANCAPQQSLDIDCAVQHIDDVPSLTPGGSCMTEQFKIGEEFQKVSKESFDAAVRAYGEANKGFQAIAAEITDYSKKAFEDATRAFEQLVGVKSVEQAIEIQSQYAKKAFENYIAEVSKLGEMYVGLARSAYKPLENALARKVA